MPVLWVRVDPECQWLMSMFMEQADIVSLWQCMLRYERCLRTADYSIGHAEILDLCVTVCV